MLRSDFIKSSSLTTGALLLFPSVLLAKNKPHYDADNLFLEKLIAANDKQVETLMQSYLKGNVTFSRTVGSHFSACAAAYCSARSGFYHHQGVADTMMAQIALMLQNQTADGTINFSNQESPPDTSFLLELLCPGVHILQKDGSEASKKIESAIKPFLLKAAETIRKGGVHTPNHRWVISAALAQLHGVFPNEAYKTRVEEWLADGVFCDKDGHYPERSAIYAAVENTAFISISRMLDKPDLLHAVRRNLTLNAYYLEPDGNLVTTPSRRQDQYGTHSILYYYFCYRYLAILDKNPMFGAMVEFMETLPEFATLVLPKALFTCMENDMLLNKLPDVGKIPQDFTKFLPTVSTLRIRRGNTTATLFGGADHPIIIASGRSNSPNFFSYRKGLAILQYMRLSTAFFSTGYFYSDGLVQNKQGYSLYKRLEVPYYDPMKPEKRKPNGDYELSPSIDNRFWNKMDFANRPVNTLKTLEIQVELQENDGKIQLDFKINGLKDVNITIELCFANGGKLNGAEGITNDDYMLKQGYATYTAGNDVIKFGPGIYLHSNIRNLEGERYGTHFGTLRTNGTHVYLTGKTPFVHTMFFE
jgi:hypothetical protein